MGNQASATSFQPVVTNNKGAFLYFWQKWQGAERKVKECDFLLFGEEIPVVRLDPNPERNQENARKILNTTEKLRHRIRNASAELVPASASQESDIFQQVADLDRSAKQLKMIHDNRKEWEEYNQKKKQLESMQGELPRLRRSIQGKEKILAESKSRLSKYRRHPSSGVTYQDQRGKAEVDHLVRTIRSTERDVRDMYKKIDEVTKLAQDICQPPDIVDTSKVGESFAAFQASKGQLRRLLHPRLFRFLFHDRDERYENYYKDLEECLTVLKSGICKCGAHLDNHDVVYDKLPSKSREVEERLRSEAGPDFLLSFDENATGDQTGRTQDAPNTTKDSVPSIGQPGLDSEASTTVASDEPLQFSSPSQ